MAPDPKKPTPAGNPERQKMMRVLIPAVSIALIIVLVAIVVSLTEGGNSGNDKDKKGGKGPGGYPPPAGGSDVSKLSDGSSPTADDPNLQPIGSEGLKYRDLKVGDGTEVRSGDTVTAYYTGWLTNGTVFDSARERGEASTFGLNNVVRGWTEGIPGMKVGGIRKLVIPPELGYGARGKGKVPPNATMIFEVEIVGVK